MVQAGTATVAFDGREVVGLVAGSVFSVPAVPHDSWVGGDDEYLSLHFLGTEHYGMSADVKAHPRAA